MPRVGRAQATRELRTWSLLGLGLAVTEAGVVAVVVKNIFAGALDAAWLNQAVAFAAATPALANLTSFLWADIGAGRAKVSTICLLLSAASLSLVAIALVPLNGFGVAAFIAGIFASRVFWTGALTLRSAVWRANYPPDVRATFTAKASVLSVLAMAFSSAVCGVALEYSLEAFRYVYPLTGAAIVLSALSYRRVRVRRHRQLLAAETAERRYGRPGLRGAYSLLMTDTDYRRYLTWMFLFGSGNLMLVGQLVLILADQLDASRLSQMLITSAVPLATIPLSIPYWALYFDRVHITEFRAVQGWCFAAAAVAYLAGAVSGFMPVLFVGAVALGTGLAGGLLGWHLGHNAFATDGRATDYMALHVTLTGLRGVAAPIIGVGFYQLLEFTTPGSGAYALLLPLVLSSSGTLGFGRMARDRRRGRGFQPR